MRRGLWFLGMVLAAGCTKANPAATCTANGQCSDPAFPFCDVDGTLGGTPGECIAASCTPGDIAGCSGSDELVCNSTGTSFDTQACVNGCAGSGCIACVANETSCVNDTLSTCDGSGNVASSVACSVGCSADSTRCLTMVPSNGLAAQLATVPSPPDLDFENGTLDVLAATFTPDGGSAVDVVLQSVDAPDDGVPLYVLVTNKLTLNNVTIFAKTNSHAPLPLGLAVIATGDISVQGTLDVELQGFAEEHCNGAAPRAVTDGGFMFTSGAGGGGFGTEGADGGGIGTIVPGSVGGSVSGNETLIPLRGGCQGGNTGGLHLSGGGGAVQLSSFTRVDIAGEVKADAPGPHDSFGAGGAAGGGILIEAPIVTLETNGALLARGAGGAAGDGTDGVTQDDALSDPGGVCTGSTEQVTCSDGGAGASPSVAAQNGVDLNTTGSANTSAGGGGGGLGRIRINTASGTFTPGANSLVAGALTTGRVTTQ